MLAVLDYNCGLSNTQATTKDGKRRYRQIFSKMMQNWVVKKISKRKDQEYIHELLSSTLEAPSDTTGDKLPRIGLIPIALIEKPDKEEAIENMIMCASFSCNFMPCSGCSALHGVNPY